MKGFRRRVLRLGSLRPETGPVGSRRAGTSRNAERRAPREVQGLDPREWRGGKPQSEQREASSWNCARDRSEALGRDEGESWGAPGAPTVPGGGGAGRRQLDRGQRGKDAGWEVG